MLRRKLFSADWIYDPDYPATRITLADQLRETCYSVAKTEYPQFRFDIRVRQIQKPTRRMVHRFHVVVYLVCKNKEDLAIHCLNMNLRELAIYLELKIMKYL